VLFSVLFPEKLRIRENSRISGAGNSSDADHPYYMLSSDCSLVPHHVFPIDDCGWPGGLQLDLEDQRCHLYTSQDDQDAQDDTLPGRPQA